MIEKTNISISIRRQCQLLELNRNRLEASRQKMNEDDLSLCRLIDEIHLQAPAFGARQIRDLLRVEHGISVGRHRVGRLMKVMGIEAIYCRPRTSIPGKGDEHKKSPYLLTNKEIESPDEVWCADITYIPMGGSFCYLVAVMDWYTRSVLSWKLSNTMDVDFCLEAFREAVEISGKTPDIFNTDQGSQFTSEAWREELGSHKIQLSMDGKGCWVDNVFIERLWRSVKYEEVYLREYRDLHELECALGKWFDRYNHWRPHSSLAGHRPWEVYRPKGKNPIEKEEEKAA